MAVFFSLMAMFTAAFVSIEALAESPTQGLSGQEEGLLATGLQLVEIETENGEEPTCELICAPGGTVPVTIGSAPKLKSRIVIKEGVETVYDSGPYVKGESGATVKVRGNSTATEDKKSFKLKLQAAADLLLRGDDARYADKEWVLLNHGGYLSTAIGFKVNELVGMQWTPGIRYVNVTVNGDYRGLYILCEAVTRNPSCRLDVAKKDGFVFEYDVFWWNEDVAFRTSFCDSNAGFTFKYPDSDDVTAEQVASLSNALERVWSSVVDGTYPGRIDVDSWASWLLAHDLLGSYDWCGSNIYLTKYDLSESSKVRMGNIWDLDGIEYTSATWSNIRERGYFLFDDLLASENPAFREAYGAKWAELRKTVLGEVEAYLTELGSSAYGRGISQSRDLDCQRWGTVRESFADELARHRAWFRSRVAWMDERITVPPVEPPVEPLPTEPSVEPSEEPVVESVEPPVAEIVEPTGAFAASSAMTRNGVLMQDGTAVGVLQVKIGKESKGESKVSVTVIGLDGKKYTSKAVKVPTGGTETQTFEVKKLGTLTLTFGANGFSGSLNGAVATSVAGTAATTDGAATFAAGDLSSLAGVLTKYLPQDEAVGRTEKKWTVKAKAGKLKYVKPNEKKGITGGLEAKGDNIAALKLTYAAKTQTFKGSFKVWTIDPVKKKLKSVSAKVSGVVVNGVGYGEVIVRNTKIGKLTVK